jgi:phenylpropionate dioxygenase-like ring-hydroxylating dioxygenase large terminal subunit
MANEPCMQMLPVEEAARRFGRGPVAAAPYFDPACWELERQAIFLRTWLHVGHVCELPRPGRFIRRDLEFANASLLIVRGRDGEIRGFHNVCTHRGTQLVADAQGKRASFTCPYHSWTFGLDGQLVAAPDFERFHLEKQACGLKQVALEICAGMIFINFEKQPRQSVREFLGPIAAQLETLPVARAVDFTEWSYEIEANWKLNFDNFQENYHLRFIHPRTGEQIIGPENPFGYPTAYGFWGPHRSQTLWKNPSPPPLPPALLDAHMRAAKLAQQDGALWPKTDFKLFPCLHVVGLATNFYTHTMMPLGPTRTRGQVRMYWTSENDSASRLYTREFTTMAIRDVLAEDRFTVEAGQRGISSGAIDKVHFQDHEVLLRHLYETVQAKVADYKLERG